jgi:hypothetical protein
MKLTFGNVGEVVGGRQVVKEKNIAVSQMRCGLVRPDFRANFFEEVDNASTRQQQRAAEENYPLDRAIRHIRE